MGGGVLPRKLQGRMGGGKSRATHLPTWGTTPHFHTYNGTCSPSTTGGSGIYVIDSLLLILFVVCWFLIRIVLGLLDFGWVLILWCTLFVGLCFSMTYVLPNNYTLNVYNIITLKKSPIKQQWILNELQRPAVKAALSVQVEKSYPYHTG